MNLAFVGLYNEENLGDPIILDVRNCYINVIYKW